MCTKIHKRVDFDCSRNKTYVTYSKDEYDRLPIDSILYLYGYKRVSVEEWNNVFIEVNEYKCNEMIVHKSSIKYTRLHEDGI